MLASLTSLAHRVFTLLLPLLAVIAFSSTLQAEELDANNQNAPEEVAEEVAIHTEQPVAMSVEELKKKVIELNRDLFILEEDLLFPANTQFIVYLSLDTGQFLKLDSVKLKLNDDIIAAHLYTDRQLKALQRGGIQRLHIGNLKTGEHEVTVFVEGIGPGNRPYKLAATQMIEKDTELKALEVRIKDRSADYEPVVTIEEWETE
ncbi:MAG: AraC family transcriptional regulator [Oleiphilaceae bacterium]|nr:AraC family transcriptional regulator [Oleiphilaceae bacterium]